MKSLYLIITIMLFGLIGCENSISTNREFLVYQSYPPVYNQWMQESHNDLVNDSVGYNYMFLTKDNNYEIIHRISDLYALVYIEYGSLGSQLPKYSEYPEANRYYFYLKDSINNTVYKTKSDRRAGNHLIFDNNNEFYDLLSKKSGKTYFVSIYDHDFKLLNSYTIESLGPVIFKSSKDKFIPAFKNVSQ